MSLLEVKNLNFDYPTKSVLKNINFSLKDNSVTALVGPNGAGKTTLLRCLASLEKPLSGNVTIDNIDVHSNPRQAHRSMGYLSDFFGLYNELSVRQCLTYMAWCHKLGSKDLQEKIQKISQDFDIEEYLDTKAGFLSRGYKQRLGIALALIHNPKTLLLDEPASGMDPEARIKLSELLLRLRESGMTIIVSSHILAELEDYCTDMLILRDGEIKSHVTLQDHQRIEETQIVIRLCEMTDDYAQIIEKHKSVTGLRKDDNQIICTFNGDQQAQSKFLAYLIRKKLPILGFTPTQKTLKSAYMDLTVSRQDASE